MNDTQFISLAFVYIFQTLSTVLWLAGFPIGWHLSRSYIPGPFSQYSLWRACLLYFFCLISVNALAFVLIPYTR